AFMFRREQAENWMNGSQQTYLYNFDLTPNNPAPYDHQHVVWDPLGRFYYIYYSGLFRTLQVFAPGAGTYTKSERVEYTQDAGLTYTSNARVLERQVIDQSSNFQQTRYSY